MPVLSPGALPAPRAHRIDHPGLGLRPMPLAREGSRLPVPGAGDAADPIRFRVCRSPERLPEILQLRRLAFAAPRSPDPGSTETVEHDPRDEDASVVIAESAGRIIGSVRLYRPLPGPILHHTSRLSGSVQGLPAKADYIETSRACIHPDHRGRGLFWHLVAHMLHAARAFGRPYLLAGTERHHWRNWRRCGFTKIGATYRRAHSEAEYSVLVLELRRTLEQRGIAPELARALAPLLDSAPRATAGHDLSVSGAP